ncbi:integrase core domain-containing protein [Hydrogenophaga sp.]|uniref:integrase core domain-containing protein n=1 Tax=Hydrogenophaga sp. TaxID=1904254 RepID=UPI00345B91E1
MVGQALPLNSVKAAPCCAGLLIRARLVWACVLGIKHGYSSPTPQTNGEGKRFIETCLDAWASWKAWNDCIESNAWQQSFQSYFNTRRPHSALGHRIPLPA